MLIQQTCPVEFSNYVNLPEFKERKFMAHKAVCIAEVPAVTSKILTNYMCFHKFTTDRMNAFFSQTALVRSRLVLDCFFLCPSKRVPSDHPNFAQTKTKHATKLHGLPCPLISCFTWQNADWKILTKSSQRTVICSLLVRFSTVYEIVADNSLSYLAQSVNLAYMHLHSCHLLTSSHCYSQACLLFMLLLATLATSR